MEIFLVDLYPQVCRWCARWLHLGQEGDLQVLQNCPEASTNAVVRLLHLGLKNKKNIYNHHELVQDLDKSITCKIKEKFSEKFKPAIGMVMPDSYF